MVEFPVVWQGVLTGALYSLLGLSYLLTFQATKVLSFAIGGMATLAALAAATWTAWPPLVSGLLAVMLAAAAAVGIEVAVARPMQARQVGHFGTVLALAASLFVLIQLTGFFFGQLTVLGRPLAEGTLSVAGRQMTYHSLITVGGALGATLAAYLWMRKGKRGRLLAALGDNAEATRILCLPVGSVRLLAVTLAGCAAGLCGVLQAGRSPITFQTGFELSLLGFLAVVIGGLSSAWGPLCGGMLLGLVESVGARVIGARWRDYLLLVVVFAAFRVRPQGIFATQVREWE